MYETCVHCRLGWCRVVSGWLEAERASLERERQRGDIENPTVQFRFTPGASPENPRVAGVLHVFVLSFTLGRNSSMARYVKGCKRVRQRGGRT